MFGVAFKTACWWLLIGPPDRGKMAPKAAAPANTCNNDMVRAVTLAIVVA